MESNLNIPVENTPVASTQPADTGIPPAAPIPNTPITPGQSEESKKPILMLIIGAILVLAVVGGIFLYINNQQTGSNQQTELQSPTPVPDENLEEELSRIDVEATGSSELDELEQTLPQL